MNLKQFGNIHHYILFYSKLIKLKKVFINSRRRTSASEIHHIHRRFAATTALIISVMAVIFP